MDSFLLTCFALLAFCKCILFAKYYPAQGFGNQLHEESNHITGHSSSLAFCLQLQLPVTRGFLKFSSVNCRLFLLLELRSRILMK